MPSCELAIASASIEGIILDWDVGAERALGISRGEALGENLGSLLGELDLIDHAIGRVRDGERVEALEISFWDKDERGIPVELTLSPMRDGSGAVAYISVVACIGRGRADRTEAENGDWAGRALLDNTSDLVICYDRELRRIYVNAAFERLFGGGAGSSLGRSPLDGGPLYKNSEYVSCLRSCFEDGENREITAPFRMPNDQTCWAHAYFLPELASDGRVRTVLVWARDIHKYKMLERSFQMLAEGIPDFVARLDLSCRFVYSSPGMGELLGRSDGDLSGIELSGLIGAGEGQAMLAELVRASLADGDAREGEVCFLREGSSLFFETHIVPERDAAGDVVSVLCCARDITKRKISEQERDTHLHFMEAIEKVNEAIREAETEEGMVNAVLDCALEVFACDRANVIFPCDPGAKTWLVEMERTKPEYPGDLECERGEVPMDSVSAKLAESLLESSQPLAIGPGLDVSFCPERMEGFRFKSALSTVLRPKGGSPRSFNLHQCSCFRDWTEQERGLFQQIGNRLEDGLNAMLARQAMEESNVRLREAQRIARLGNWEYNLDTRVLRLSEETLRILELDTSSNFVGIETLRERIHFEDRERVGEKIFQASGNQPRYSLEFRISLPSGVIKHVRWEGEVLQGGGKPVRLFGTMQDVTERKADKAALELFRNLIDNANDTIEVVDAETGCFVDVNSRACQMHGYTREEYLQLRVRDVDLSVGEQPWAHFFDSLKPLENTRMESMHRRKDGSVFPVDVSLSVVTLDKDFVVAVVRDITDRVRSERALRQSELRFRQVTDSINEVFWLTEADLSEIIYASPAYETIWGRPVSDLYRDADSWLEAVHPEDRDRVQGELYGDLNSELDMKFRIQRPDGSIRWVFARHFPVMDDDGRVVRLAGVVSDITERQEAESQYLHAQKMEEMGRFAGSIAHDFNNLLAAIQLQTSMLLSSADLSVPIRDGIESIEGVSERAAELTRRILMFTRREAASMKDVDLAVLIKGMGKWLRRLLGENMRFKIRSADHLPLVTCDPGMMEQILVNLSVNARDAMPKGGSLTISLSTEELDEERLAMHPSAKPGRFVLWEVADTGSGIPEETLSRIFEPYFTTKPKDRGTGLGLATVYGIVRQHGGGVEVKSSPGEGTRFLILLPACPGCLLADDQEKTASLTATEGGATILVVEDDEELRSLIRLTLERMSYHVFEAADGEAAIALWNDLSRRVDLVMTDLVMPGNISGMSMVKSLKSRDPELKSVYMSGYVPEKADQGTRLTPGENFLSKPFSQAELSSIIRFQLGDGEAEQG